MMAAPSGKPRTPSSARAVNVAGPPAKENVPVQRTEKLSTGSPVGPPAPYTLLIVSSQAVCVAGGVRVKLPKYWAKKRPVGQLSAGVVIRKVAALEVRPTTNTAVMLAGPAVAMSSVDMIA